ncbi:hypothetical protein FJT64_001790 [Amphibalanus amphitrite]|uniref:Peptidase A2 domain-containing protein n=1 Tax=Amphibalanus amphitrite TaxID=1232801 RepID=A0A6A4X7S2_AMPAM|nr:hypothetical protein FJT64_001790 [Amphibalanus amphitrite]
MPAPAVHQIVVQDCCIQKSSLSSSGRAEGLPLSMKTQFGHHIFGHQRGLRTRIQQGTNLFGLAVTAEDGDRHHLQQCRDIIGFQRRCSDYALTAGTDFEKWLRALERYMVAMDIQGPTRRCAVLLHLVGPDIADVSDSLPEEEAEGPEEDEFTRLKRKLVRYLVPRNNVVAERGKFQGMTMEPEESLEEFLARLRTQILRCGYEPAQVNRELRDRCVLGSRGELQRKLVREAALKGDELNLEDVRRTARAHRDVMDLTTRLSGAPVPAATDGEAVQVDRLPLVTLSVNGRETEMLVDTGSPVSIVADGSIPGLKLRPSKMQLRSFTGQPVPVRGEATVQAEYGGQRKRLNVVVSGQLRHHPLLGRDWLREIRLDWRSLLQVSEASKVSGGRTLSSVTAAHAAVFAGGLGTMEQRAHLTLKPDAVPRRLPPRPVPCALLPQVENDGAAKALGRLYRWRSAGSVPAPAEATEKTAEQ